MANKRNNKNKQTWRTPLLPILLAVLATLVILGIFVPGRPRQRHYARRVVCLANLHTLGKALAAYAKEQDGKYPTTDKWCDLLIEHAEVSERAFVCPSAGEGLCHYAINPNCKPNSPADMVLLFETKGGWNQFGGPEILTTENHKGKGCNILFNNGRVEFVKPERLGELKWEVEEGEK
ncbi:hypothetical protein ES703_82890 [subsurface metagenome]